MKKAIILGILLVFMAGSFSAQILYKEDPPVLIKYEGMGGIFLHTEGFGFNYRKAKNITFNRRWIWEIDGETMTHPKEVSTTNQYIENAKSYVYGKLNNLYILHAGYGRQHILYGIENKGNVEIRLTYIGGLSLGIAKPVYLDVLTDASQGTTGEATEKFDPLNPQHPENIIGKASFTYGFDELKLHPGLYGRCGLSFMDKTENNTVYVLETGFTFDAYMSKIPIMALTDNNQFYLTFYLNFMIGKKW
ncbi:MAG: hypothetical protein WCL14_00210 [Bacteroidota bacterium]